MPSKAATLLLFLAGFLALGIALPQVLPAQAAESPLREGLRYFQAGEYREAISSFRSIISESGDSSQPRVKADAYYWLARAYMAVNMYDEAARNLEFFLSSYPEHRLYPEAFYQKGRLLFLQGEAQNAILVFQQFLERYPDNDLVANALYWIGESLYSLGQLDAAARVFARVVNEYPRSYKVSDAGYRLSLIQFKKREDELMKLLKWSHEETLRVTEEFQRREKAYEQAIAIYQGRLSAAGQAAQSASNSEIAGLRTENERLQQRIATLEAQLAGEVAAQSAKSSEITALRTENERLRQRIAALETQLAGVAAQESAAAGASAEFENRQKLLQAKADALAVKEALLDALAAQVQETE